MTDLCAKCHFILCTMRLVTICPDPGSLNLVQGYLNLEIKVTFLLGKSVELSPHPFSKKDYHHRIITTRGKWCAELTRAKNVQEILLRYVWSLHTGGCKILI